MTASAIEIRETVDVSLLSNLSSNFRSPYEAIFELVDNGLASRRDDAMVSFTVTGSGWSGQGGTLKTVTKGGLGMGAGELPEFLHWGKRPDAAGLNRYGQGGKAAIGYLGEGFRIRANRHGEDQAYEFEDEDWLNRQNGEEKRFIARPVPAAVPGSAVVEIEIFGLRRRINARRLERELSWRYRPALVDGALELRVRGKKIKPVPLQGETRKDFKHRILVTTLDHPDGEEVELRGWVGIAPSKFEGRGDIRCSAFGRVIVQHEYFEHRTASYKASLNSLVGEIDMSFVPPLLNKNAFEDASPAWEVVQDIAYREMEPFVESLLKRKDPSEASDEERERAMEAKDLAHEALDRIAAESSRHGAGGGARGRKPPKRQERRSEPRSQDGESPEPRTPPPPDAVGNLRRKGDAIDWDVRPLDPRIRSATESQNGRVEIVINNRYPLYLERKGDLPYMLETGLLEEMKPSDDEERPVGEYHEEVCQALYEALTTGTGR